MDSGDKKLVKNNINEQSIYIIAKVLKTIDPAFDDVSFCNRSKQKLSTLELKERVTHIINHLHDHLSDDFYQTAVIFKQIPNVWPDDSEKDRAFAFTAWPLIDYVGVYGANFPELSLEVLEVLTPLFTAEFAIRPFMTEHFERLLPILNVWVLSENEHVRRLVSEGIRPRLPWGLQLKQFIADPKPILPLLDTLKFDESEYVRRSVANNLNDISKDHPDLVMNVCSQWVNAAKTDREKHTVNWLIKHALRTLIKQGNPKVFILLGYTAKPTVGITSFIIKTPSISVGEDVVFELTLQGSSDYNHIVVDYAIHFVKANGKTAEKVFKLKNCKLIGNEKVIIRKKHSFKVISTRAYYEGKHVLVLHINGVPVAEQIFELSV